MLKSLKLTTTNLPGHTASLHTSVSVISVEDTSVQRDLHVRDRVRTPSLHVTLQSDQFDQLVKTSPSKKHG